MNARWQLLPMIAVLVAVCVATLLPKPMSRIDFATDTDARQIRAGLESSLSHLSWWHGSWVEQINIYFRPLTSELWSLEWKAFGPDWNRWRWVTFALHLAVALLLFGFVSAVFRSRWAGFLAGLFAASSAVMFRQSLWWFPFQTSLLCDMFMFTALWLLTTYLNRDGWGWLVVAWAAALLAICSKELGFILPLAVLVVLWYRRAPLRLALPFVVLAGGLWFYRSAVLPPWEQQSYLATAHIRFLWFTVGPLAQPFFGLLRGIPQWPALWTLAVALLVTLAILRPRLRPVAVVALALAIPVTQWTHGDWLVALLPATWGGVPVIVAYLVAAVLLVRYARREFAFAFALMVILFLPTSAVGSAPFYFYEPALGRAIIWALLAALAVQAMRDFANQKIHTFGMNAGVSPAPYSIAR